MAAHDFTDFFGRNFGWVRLYAGRHRGLDPDDLAQVTFVRAYENWDTFDPHEPGAWLRTVLDHAAIDERRKQQPVRVGDVDALLLPGPGHDDPAEHAVRAEEGRLAREAMKDLSPRDRNLVQRKIIEDASYDVVAAELGVSKVTARQKVHRAVCRLAKLVNERSVIGIVVAAFGAMLGVIRKWVASAPTGLTASAGAVALAVGAGVGFFGPDTDPGPEVTMPTPASTAPAIPSSSAAPSNATDEPTAATPKTRPRTSLPSPPPDAQARGDDAAPPSQPPMDVSVDVPPPDTGPGTKQSHDARVPTPAGDVETGNNIHTSRRLLDAMCDSGVDVCEPHPAGRTSGQGP